MALKRAIDEVFGQNSKFSESFNKERADKIVSSVVKQESSDSEDRRIQIRAFFRCSGVNNLSSSFSTVESKSKCRKLHSFTASISGLTIKEFARIQRNKDREELKWKRAQILIQRVEKRSRRTFHRFFKDFPHIVVFFIEHLFRKSVDSEFEWTLFISFAFFEVSLNLAIFESSLESSNDIENSSLFGFKVRD